MWPSQNLYCGIICILAAVLDHSTVESFLVSNKQLNFPLQRGALPLSRPSSCRHFHFPNFDLSFVPHGLQGIEQIVHGALDPAQSATSAATSVVLSADEPSGSLNPLGNDLLIFLCATIGIVPLFKWLKASPVIGFLSAGLLMGPAGLHLFSDLDDMESLADFGVLFLLFEQGLELTVDRLKSLSKFAFGMGTLQVALCTGAFFTFPFVGGVQFLEFFMGSAASVVDITRIDEALVIGAALSLSSSAFVLKILQEKGQLATRFGAACLGILLLQDIAVVPLLVLLPIIETSGPMPLSAQAALLGATFLKALLGLGGILVVGGGIVRFLFSLVAKTRSSETFVALCLLVALGTGALTDALGLSSTLGAFTAGTLLAESNYRTQIEADIKPFRGLLLGLFFLTTGASVEPLVLQQEWPTVLALTAGLIAFKAVITTLLGPFFGLSRSDSVRTGLLLAGGGEFAFVVLTLADKLDVLPDLLAKILVGVVVISMALTPTLSSIADKIAGYIDQQDRKNSLDSAMMSGAIPSSGGNEFSEANVVVICGFGPVGETVARFLTTVSATLSAQGQGQSANTANPAVAVVGGWASGRETKYVAFDLDPDVVIRGFKSGKRVLYGDGSQPKVLTTAGIEDPQAFVVTYADSEMASKAVERLRLAYPSVPILSRALDSSESIHLLKVGATRTVPDERESSISMATVLLRDVLQMDSARLGELSNELRLRVEEDERNEFEVLQRRSGLKSSTDRVSSDDEMSSLPAPFRSMVSQSQQLGENVAPVLNDVTRRFADLMGSAKSFLVDQSAEVDASVPGSTDGFETGNIDDLGVLVCALPPKAAKKAEPTEEAGLLALENIEDLGVLVCALPPKGLRKDDKDAS